MSKVHVSCQLFWLTAFRDKPPPPPKKIKLNKINPWMKLYHNVHSDTKLAINDIHVCPENMSVNIISFHTVNPWLSPPSPPLNIFH